MSFTHAVLGAGRQGIAAAADLLLFGDASRLLLADADLTAAERVARRLDALAGRCVTEPIGFDATDPGSLRRVLEPADAVLSALPYQLNPLVARAAVEARAHYADLGGNTMISAQVLAMDAHARAAGVTVVPDCGLAPGLAATLAAHAVDSLDEPRSVAIRCGGLPAAPRGPLGYQLVFSVHGLVNEYLGEAEVLRDGRVSRVPTLAEIEELEFAAIGRCEAFTTSGGSSTLPRSFLGRLSDLDYKTVRYPGHCEKVRAMRDLGLWSEEPVDVAGARVVPRRVFEAVAERALASEAPDVVVLRVEASGRRDGRDATLRLDVVDFADARTGFSAMQRMTGFPAAMVLALLARGEAPPGSATVEQLPHAPLVAGLAARGIRLERILS